MANRESFAQRGRRAQGLYTTDRWPSKHPMCMHHERSYAWEFPSTMLFACLQAPTEGGATALADSAAVLEALPPRLVERFARHGWMLTRNYNHDIGASIADSFGADRRGYVEAYCRANAIEFTWRSGGRLRTRQRRSAVVGHPLSGLRCWFNQVAFLNEWTLDPELREFLVGTYGRDGLPFNTSYGNGEPIDAEVIALLNAVYDTHAVREPWRAGDLMLVDNIRTAHSRDPFKGPREVLVAMAHPRTPAYGWKETVP
jgi:alpha-ketoglutarate-dependent taurine dioxygenase